MAHSHACTDPQHHVHDSDGFVREVERACEQRGLRLTPIRANALRLIAVAGRPIKAYDLLDQMKATPVHDFFAPNGQIRADGRMVHDMYLAQVKTPDESKGRWDYLKILRTIPADQAFLPLSESKCPLVTQ